MQKYKFDKERYITKGINKTLSTEVTLYLWSLIEDLEKEGVPLDYLQVFEIFSEAKDMVKIVHSQEIPPYKKVHRIKLQENIKGNIKGKVFVIDDITHTTMLMDYEY